MFNRNSSTMNENGGGATHLYPEDDGLVDPDQYLWSTGVSRGIYDQSSSRIASI